MNKTCDVVDDRSGNGIITIKEKSMKKSLTMAALAGVIAAPASAAINMENPLFMPSAGEVALSLGGGVMFKQTDDTPALQARNHANTSEFPIWRGSFNFGYGITDWLAVRGQFAYTHNSDAPGATRSGMNEGRVGLVLRASEFVNTNGIVWDVYADASLGGVSRKDITLPIPGNIIYNNYSTGRFGAWLGTRVGKTFDNLTVSAFAEVLQTFGNDNSRVTIDVGPAGMMAPPIAALDGQRFSVTSESSTEFQGGFNAFYQLDSEWSFGGGFTFRHRPANRIESVNLSNDQLALLGAAAALNPALGGMADAIIGSQRDNMNEYILSAVVARQLSDTMQIALYGEYTFDTNGPGSINGTDVKFETGVRLNVRF